MNQKEPTKTFVMISNWKKPFGLHGLHKKYSALRVKGEIQMLRTALDATIAPKGLIRISGDKAELIVWRKYELESN